MNQKDRLRTHEKFEIFLIVLFTIGVWLGRDFFPKTTSLGSVCLILASLFLGQGLVRDLWLWTWVHRVPEADLTPKIARPYMCVESIVGLGGVSLGLLLLAAFSGHALKVEMFPWLWSVLLTAVVIGGFLMKDLVFDWAQRKILLERDHYNIIPRRH